MLLLLRVNQLMRLQVDVRDKFLPADFTAKGTGICVDSHVDFQVGFAHIFLPANAARMLPVALGSVSGFMGKAESFPHEFFLTAYYAALERLNAHMAILVIDQRSLCLEPHTAR